MATIKEALKYPFQNFSRLWNFYWILIPIWGWFVVMGYIFRIVQAAQKPNPKELPGLPAIRPFTGLFTLGFKMFVFAIVLNLVVFLVMLIPYVGLLLYLIVALLSNFLMLQLAITGKLSEAFNIVKASKDLIANFGQYILTFLKILVVALVFLVLSIPIVTLVVTIPAAGYAQYYLLADFYRQKK